MSVAAYYSVVRFFVDMAHRLHFVDNNLIFSIQYSSNILLALAADYQVKNIELEQMDL